MRDEERLTRYVLQQTWPAMSLHSSLLEYSTLYCDQFQYVSKATSNPSIWKKTWSEWGKLK